MAVATCLATLILAWPDSSHAQRVRVRSLTAGRATQYLRSDRTISAPRIFTQGFSIRGYDLAGDQTGSVNATVSFRYLNDFSLGRVERDDPYLGQYWNEFDLDLAYVDWSPLGDLELRAGRQWNYSALGVRDFDGLSVSWRPHLADGVRASLGVYGGLDVETAYSRFAPDTWDVQGLPPNESVDPAAVEGTAMIAGGRAGLTLGEAARMNVSYRKRWRVGATNPYDGDDIVGSERMGLASSTPVGKRGTVSAHGIYNTTIDGVDSAGVTTAWRLPGPLGTLSAGADHRIPWFDSSSIFNVFGSRGHQGVFTVYQHGVESLRTQFEGRGWGRIYHGDVRGLGPTVTTRDERALGGALAHRTRLRLWSHPVRWSSQASVQGSLDRDTHQYLADTRVRLPVGWQDLFVSGRALFLAAVPERFSERAGFASSFVLGLDAPLGDAAKFSLAVESTTSTYSPASTSFFASLLVDHWP
ncbi:MAG: hypothetical protein ACQEVA_16490 [Myxococcota bacterium]